MFKKIINTIIIVLIFIGLLSLGGYTLTEVKHAAQIKNPQDVFAPIISKLPELPKSDLPEVSNNTTSTTESKDVIDNNTEYLVSNTEETINNVENQDILISTTEEKQKHTVTVSSKRTIKVTIDDKSMELNSETTLTFLKWLTNNYNDKSKVTYEETTPPEILEEIEKDEKSNKESITYNTILTDEKELNTIVDSINIVKSLEDLNDYDRTTYEKPVQSYMLNNTKINRNDYAWKTSKWFNEEDFTYICPYTGTIIKDLDDNKEDKDFGNLDYDHIVPLKSTYLRGANKWSDDKKNEYAYDQWVGVDVLNSANRSKSDKGPSEWLPTQNVEDYCYSWLLICSKYNLSMTQEEIDICIDNIKIALQNGETVEHIGGFSE